MFPIPKNILWAGGAASSAAVAGVAAYVAATRAPEAPVAREPAALVSPLAPAAGKAPAVENAAPTRPQFDVARVEKSGEIVVAGRAEPNASVVLLNKGVRIAEGKADSSGQFVILPPALPPGDHLLTLRSNGPSGGIESEQNIAAVVPARPGDQVVAVLSSPEQPTRVLSAPPKSAPAQPAAGAGEVKPRPESKLIAAPAAAPVAIKTADAGEDGAFLASGLAAAGATVRLYLNNAFVAAVRAGPTGDWSMRIDRGMSPGHYDIRADVVEANDGKVTARAEAPFDFPELKKAGTALGAKRDPAQIQETAAEPGQVVIQNIQSVKVERGDSLWRISRRVLGHGIRYTQIYEANSAQIRDPNRIWPGQVFVAPRQQDGAGPVEAARK